MENTDRLGDLLLNAGNISREQLAKALTIQAKTHQRLGRTLINLGYVSEAALLSVWESQLGIKRVDLTSDQVDRRVALSIPRSLAERYQVIPIARHGQVLLLGMTDPTDTAAIAAVRMAAGGEVKPLLASEQAVLQAISRTYELLPANKAATDLWQSPAASEEMSATDLINTVISQAIREKASDIHLEPQERHFRIRLRVDGFLREFALLPRQTHAAATSRLKLLSEMDIAEKRLPQDGRLKVIEDGREVDIRVATLPTIFGEKIVMRLFDKQTVIFDLNRLGLSERTLAQYRSLYCQPYGLMLVTGPTGAGKTTTLYATLAALNTTDRNIITVEDPVEYQLDGINQVQVNPKAGMKFANGLRSILRQDPDIIMVGEIRDIETADIAIRAALTGHLVLSTLHTNDAAGAITRLLDMGVAPFLAASSVLGVVAQRLVRKICPECQEWYSLPPDSPERAYWGLGAGPLRLCRSRGCPACGQTGYQGRLAIVEVMPLTPALRRLIHSGADHDAVAACAISEGMTTMRQDGFDKAVAGLTTLDEIRRVAYDPC